MKTVGTLTFKDGQWWIRYAHGGIVYEEGTGSADRRLAEGYLRRQLRSVRVVHAGGSMPTLTDARAVIVSDYTLNGRKTTKRLGVIWKHFEAFFGATQKLTEITGELCSKYAAERLQHVSRSTVWLELQIFKRALHLCHIYGLIDRVPQLPKLKGPTPRKGFLEREAFDGIKKLLPPWHKPIIEFLYWTGWRWGEAAGLTWGAVDWEAGTVRLYPGESKTEQPRVFPFRTFDPLREIIESQRRFCTALETAMGEAVPFVFFRPDGKPIASYRKTWRKACERAGYPGKLVHDLRRSAVRRMELAGVPRRIAMALAGHKTSRVYEAYAIVAEGDLAEGLIRMARYVERASKAPDTQKQEEVGQKDNKLF